MASPILVTGGTGTLGRNVVRRLRDADRQVRVLGRRIYESGDDGVEFMIGDLATGEGIEAAVDGAETIVHLAGSAKGDEGKARNLVRAASQAGTQHLVYISVVGAERIPVVSGVDRNMFGYFASKLAAEKVVADSGLPFTTLRATQFHDLMLMVAQALAKLPVVPIPAGFRIQPVDADEVAARLVGSRSESPPGWYRTSADRGRTALPKCFAATFGPPSGGVDRSCPSRCRAGQPARSGTAPTWSPSGRWDGGRGSSS